MSVVSNNSSPKRVVTGTNRHSTCCTDRVVNSLQNRKLCDWPCACRIKQQQPQEGGDLHQSPVLLLHLWDCELVPKPGRGDWLRACRIKRQQPQEGSDWNHSPHPSCCTYMVVNSFQNQKAVTGFVPVTSNNTSTKRGVTGISRPSTCCTYMVVNSFPNKKGVTGYVLAVSTGISPNMGGDWNQSPLHVLFL